MSIDDKEWGLAGYDEDPNDGKIIFCPICGERGGVRSNFEDLPCETCENKDLENDADQIPRTHDVANTTDSPERLSASVLFALGLSWWFIC